MDEQEKTQADVFFSLANDVWDTINSESAITIDLASLGTLVNETQTTAASSVVAQPSTGDNTQRESSSGTIKEALSAVPEKLDNHTSITEPLPATDAITESTEAVTIAPVDVSPGCEAESRCSEPQLLFVADALPSKASDINNQVSYERATSSCQALGDSKQEEDEVIVYNAPYPRPDSNLESQSEISEQIASAPATEQPIVPRSTSPNDSNAAPSFNAMSFNFSRITNASKNNRKQTSSPRNRRLTKKDRQAARRNETKQKPGRRGSFRLFGAMLEEKHLYEEEEELKSHRRIGSDIDWGDSDADATVVNNKDSDVDGVSSGLGAMDLDPDVDQEAVETFLKNLNMNHTSIDDLADERRMKQEDQSSESILDTSEDEGGDEDHESEDVLKYEEELLIMESEGIVAQDSGDSEESEDDVSSDEEDTPRRSFQARLKNVRANETKTKNKGKGKASASDESDEYDDDDESLLREVIGQSQEDSDAIEGQDGPSRMMLSKRQIRQTRALFNSSTGDFDSTPARRSEYLFRSKDLHFCLTLS